MLAVPVLRVGLSPFARELWFRWSNRLSLLRVLSDPVPADL
jgi:hypothetical protein